MFDVSFSELLIIAVVALLVVGPERLPKLARTAGHLLGRLQRYVSDVKADINREMQLDELKRMQQQIEDSARDVEQSVRTELDTARSEVANVGNELSDVGKSLQGDWTMTDEKPAVGQSASARGDPVRPAGGDADRAVPDATDAALPLSHELDRQPAARRSS
jgi:sec-independent protein translocase protein TatB